MKIKEILNKINFALENKYISEEDELIILGVGDKKTCLIDNISLPKVVVDYSKLLESEKSGKCNLGFINSTYEIVSFTEKEFA